MATKMCKKSLLCRLGIHNYKRISRAVPAKSCNEFNFLVNSYALGQCKRCSKFSMVECLGGLDSYYPTDIKTIDEWLKVLVKEAEAESR